MPASPRIRGTSTLADDHAYCTPPHVSPMMTDVELAVISRFPLRPNQYEYCQERDQALTSNPSARSSP